MVVNYKGHTERIQLTVTQLRKQHIMQTSLVSQLISGLCFWSQE
jgi:hypothetical protein